MFLQSISRVQISSRDRVLRVATADLYATTISILDHLKLIKDAFETVVMIDAETLMEC
jgi:hypothetical protein